MILNFTAFRGIAPETSPDYLPLKIMTNLKKINYMNICRKLPKIISSDKNSISQYKDSNSLQMKSYFQIWMG